MASRKSEEMKERLKSVAAVAAVAAVALAVVLRDPDNAAKLFHIQNLSPGMVAPEIVGADVNGKRMKLSDYRGKIVLLDFFGNW